MLTLRTTPRRTTPRRAARTTAVTVGAMATVLIGVPSAHGAPPVCNSPGFLCGEITSPGGSSGGRAPSGGGGGTTVPPPDPDVTNNFQDLGPAAPATEDLAQRVRNLAPFPAVTVHTSPADRTYVRVRTGLWVDGFQTVRTQPITLAGQTVQVTAQPKSVTWNLGETSITCTGPGRPNDTSCGHTYQRSSARQPGGAYRVSAVITWTVSWTCAGAACDDAAGTLPDEEIPSVPVPLVVDEIQANTRP